MKGVVRLISMRKQTRRILFFKNNKPYNSSKRILYHQTMFNITFSFFCSCLRTAYLRPYTTGFIQYHMKSYTMCLYYILKPVVYSRHARSLSMCGFTHLTAAEAQGRKLCQNTCLHPGSKIRSTDQQHW